MLKIRKAQIVQKPNTFEPFYFYVSMQ